MNKLKTLGLATLMALCLAATAGAASASASFGVWVNPANGNFEAEPGYEVVGSPKKLFGGAIPPTFNFFRSEKNGTCSQAHLRTQIAQPYPAMVGLAEYGECHSEGAGGLAVQVNMNRCFFIFTASSAEHSRGTEAIDCYEKGEEVEFSELLFGGVFCKASIPEQEGLQRTEYTNFGEGTSRGFDLLAPATGIKYTLSGEGCKAGTTGSHEDGSFSQWLTITGR